VLGCPARGEPRRAVTSELDLLGEGEGVLDLDAEIRDGALDLGVDEQKLDGAQIAGALVDLGRLGAPERMRAVARGIEPIGATQSATRR